MTSTKIKLYVGCSLTQAPEDFKESILNLKESLRAEGYEVLDFVGLVAGTPKDVYEWDIKHCVDACDALISVCDFPAIGLGYELNEAVRLKKPVLAIAHKDSLVTRLLLGAAEVEPNFHLMRYNDLSSDAVSLITSWLTANKLKAI